MLFQYFMTLAVSQRVMKRIVKRYIFDLQRDQDAKDGMFLLQIKFDFYLHARQNLTSTDEIVLLIKSGKYRTQVYNSNSSSHLIGWHKNKSSTSINFMLRNLKTMFLPPVHKIYNIVSISM